MSLNICLCESDSTYSGKKTFDMLIISIFVKLLHIFLGSIFLWMECGWNLGKRNFKHSNIKSQIASTSSTSFFFSRSFIAICFCNQIHKLKMKMPSPFKSQKMKNHNNVKTKTNWNKFLKNLLWAYASNLFFLSCHHNINNASATYMKNSKWN